MIVCSNANENDFMTWAKILITASDCSFFLAKYKNSRPSRYEMKSFFQDIFDKDFSNFKQVGLFMK